MSDDRQVPHPKVGNELHARLAGGIAAGDAFNVPLAISLQSTVVRIGKLERNDVVIRRSFSPSAPPSSRYRRTQASLR